MPVRKMKALSVGDRLMDKDGNVYTIQQTEIVRRRGRLQVQYDLGCGYVYSESMKHWKVV